MFLYVFVPYRNLGLRQNYGRSEVDTTTIETNGFTSDSTLPSSTNVQRCRSAAVEKMVDFVR